MVSGILLYWLWSHSDTTNAWSTVKRIRWPWLVLCGGLAAALPLCSAWRWLGILQAQEWLQVSYPLALRMVLFATPLNFFLPSKGGDLAKLVYLKNQSRLHLTLGMVVLERLIDLLVLGLFCLLGAWWSHCVWGWMIGGLLLVGISAILAAIVLLPVNRFPPSSAFWSKVKETHSILNNWFKNPRAIGVTIGGCLGVWGLTGVILVSLLAAIGRGSCWPYALAFWPLAILAGLVPLSFNGIGPRDAVFTILMAGYLSREEAAMVSLGYAFFAYFFLALVSLPMVIWETGRFFGKSQAL
ncbi:MAG: lysylphosphatidylglycerol synthase transmembrane domain-containing protein [Desulfobaccales bacterium]